MTSPINRVKVFVSCFYLLSCTSSQVDPVKLKSEPCGPLTENMQIVKATFKYTSSATLGANEIFTDTRGHWRYFIVSQYFDRVCAQKHVKAYYDFVTSLESKYYYWE